MEHDNNEGRLTAPEERFSGYEVHDADGKVGEVDEILVDEDGRPQYVGAKTGFSDVRFLLIPLEAVRVDGERRTIEVSSLPKGRIKDGPDYGGGGEITPDFEQRVRDYYGLQSARLPEGPQRSSAGYRGADDESSSGVVELDAGEHDSGFQDTDELSVQRSEEEVLADTHGRRAGAVKVRKSVRTEREQVRVPKWREEVEIERVPGEGREATEAEVGEDDEVVVQVLEEEVVVSKRVVVREEIRLRKVVVEEEEAAEVDLRKEEVDIEDTTERAAGRTTGLADETGSRER